MRLWGITGLAASGKSLALEILGQRCLPTLDLDQVAREVVDHTTRKGREGLALVVAHFGPEILLEDGALNRRALRDRIVADPSSQRALEKILHPLILRSVKEWAQAQESHGSKRAFIEGTRIVESNFHDHLSGLIVVTAPMNLRISRLAKRDHLSVAQAEALLKAQDEAGMKAHATLEWVNASDAPFLENQIDDFLRHEEKLARQTKGAS